MTKFVLSANQNHAQMHSLYGGIGINLRELKQFCKHNDIAYDLNIFKMSPARFQIVVGKRCHAHLLCLQFDFLQIETWS